MKYRKKPVAVDAWQFAPECQDRPTWVLEALIGGRITWSGGDPGYCIVHTIEGDMRARPGDWIIRGVRGELYPVKADIFAETYEEAADVECH